MTIGCAPVTAATEPANSPAHWSKSPNGNPGSVTAAEMDTARMDAAFDEAATEMEAFVGEFISKGYSALVVLGILE